MQKKVMRMGNNVIMVKPEDALVAGLKRAGCEQDVINGILIAVRAVVKSDGRQLNQVDVSNILRAIKPVEEPPAEKPLPKPQRTARVPVPKQVEGPEPASVSARGKGDLFGGPSAKREERWEVAALRTALERAMSRVNKVIPDSDKEAFLASYDAYLAARDMKDIPRGYDYTFPFGESVKTFMRELIGALRQHGIINDFDVSRKPDGVLLALKMPKVTQVELEPD